MLTHNGGQFSEGMLAVENELGLWITDITMYILDNMELRLVCVEYWVGR
jgi:hypothetical protein